jgi:hypothetical protein
MLIYIQSHSVPGKTCACCCRGKSVGGPSGCRLRIYFHHQQFELYPSPLSFIIQHHLQKVGEKVKEEKKLEAATPKI